MELSELKTYLKIKALLDKYWIAPHATKLHQGFMWSVTVQGFSFWADLTTLSEEDCKEKYPEYFTEESPKINIEHLKGWPKLYKRAELIASYAGEDDYNLVEAAHTYYNTKTNYDPEWEGTIFWDNLTRGNTEFCMRSRPALFGTKDEEQDPLRTRISMLHNTKRIPKFDSVHLPHNTVFKYDVEEKEDKPCEPEFAELPEEQLQDLAEGLKGEGLSLLHILLNQVTSFTGHSELTLNYAPTLEELLPVMEELEDFFEGHELNWSCEVRYKYDGSGSLYINDFWKRVEDSPSGKDVDKIILSWRGE